MRHPLTVLLAVLTTVIMTTNARADLAKGKVLVVSGDTIAIASVLDDAIYTYPLSQGLKNGQPEKFPTVFIDKISDVKPGDTVDLYLDTINGAGTCCGIRIIHNQGPANPPFKKR